MELLDRFRFGGTRCITNTPCAPAPTPGLAKNTPPGARNHRKSDALHEPNFPERLRVRMSLRFSRCIAAENGQELPESTPTPACRNSCVAVGPGLHAAWCASFTQIFGVSFLSSQRCAVLDPIAYVAPIGPPIRACRPALLRSTAILLQGLTALPCDGTHSLVSGRKISGCIARIFVHNACMSCSYMLRHTVNWIANKLDFLPAYTPQQHHLWEDRHEQ